MGELLYYPGIDPETQADAYAEALEIWHENAHSFYVLAAQEKQRQDKAGRHRSAIFEHLAELAKMDPEEAHLIYCEIWAHLHGDDDEDTGAD